jgi:hypothetical protein
MKVYGDWKYCTAVIIIKITIRRRCVDVAGTLDGGVQYCSTGVEVKLM